MAVQVAGFLPQYLTAEKTEQHPAKDKMYIQKSIFLSPVFNVSFVILISTNPD